MSDSLKIVDNFFEDPDGLRNYAISLRTYHPCDFHLKNQGIYSGYRTRLNNEQLEQKIISDIEKTCQRKIQMMSLVFHLNPEVSMLGCPHKDVRALSPKHKKSESDGSDIAGVIYLSKNAPPETGTTLYETPEPEEIKIENYYDKMQILYDVGIPITNKCKMGIAREMLTYKKSLTKMTESEHVYNRLILYPAEILHAPGFYYGETINDARLTIAIHGKFAE